MTKTKTEEPSEVIITALTPFSPGVEAIVTEKIKEIERLEKQVKQQKAAIEELRNRLAYAIGRCKRR